MCSNIFVCMKNGRDYVLLYAVGMWMCAYVETNRKSIMPIPNGSVFISDLHANILCGGFEWFLLVYVSSIMFTVCLYRIVFYVTRFLWVYTHIGRNMYYSELARCTHAILITRIYQFCIVCIVNAEQRYAMPKLDCDGNKLHATQQKINGTGPSDSSSVLVDCESTPTRIACWLCDPFDFTLCTHSIERHSATISLASRYNSTTIVIILKKNGLYI